MKFMRRFKAVGAMVPPAFSGRRFIMLPVIVGEPDGLRGRSHCRRADGAPAGVLGT